MSDIPADWRAVRGNTYLVREALKEIGARWDRDTQMWYVAPETLREAENLVEESRVGKRRL